MSKKTFLLDLMNQVADLENVFVLGLSESELKHAGTFERWSAKDTLAHIATWTITMVEHLQLVAAGKKPERSVDFDRENELIFHRMHPASWDEVLDMERDARSRIRAEVERMSEDDLQRMDVLPWQEERPLWRVLIGTAYLHPVTHLAGYYREAGRRPQAAEMLGAMNAVMLNLDSSPAWQGVVKYNTACQYALLGENTRAIDELRAALELNPSLEEWSQDDPDLDAIRGDKDYIALYASK